MEQRIHSSLDSDKALGPLDPHWHPDCPQLSSTDLRGSVVQPCTECKARGQFTTFLSYELHEPATILVDNIKAGSQCQGWGTAMVRVLRDAYPEADWVAKSINEEAIDFWGKMRVRERVTIHVIGAAR